MVFYIVLGCFLDGISMVVLTMGVILPTVQKAGIDPLWFGIFVVLVVEMAQITPPVGFNLFVLQGMTGREIGWIAKVTLPFFFLMVAAVVLIYVFPQHRHLAAAADALNGRIWRANAPLFAACAAGRLPTMPVQASAGAPHTPLPRESHVRPVRSAACTGSRGRRRCARHRRSRRLAARSIPSPGRRRRFACYPAPAPCDASPSPARSKA